MCLQFDNHTLSKLVEDFPASVNINLIKYSVYISFEYMAEKYTKFIYRLNFNIINELPSYPVHFNLVEL